MIYFGSLDGTRENIHNICGITSGMKTKSCLCKI